jgi:hypothetical protein
MTRASTSGSRSHYSFFGFKHKSLSVDPESGPCLSDVCRALSNTKEEPRKERIKKTPHNHQEIYFAEALVSCVSINPR